MGTRDDDAAVIGAGVTGLTTAICLAEAGLRVSVTAAEPPLRTTSVAAGAIWGPHLVGMDDRVRRWAEVTLGRLSDLAGDPATGVRMTGGIEASRQRRPDPPGWLIRLVGRTRCDPADLPPGFAAGWRLTAPVASMPAYLGYLATRLERAGGQVRVAPIGFRSLNDAAALSAAPVIVNCSGTGARDLVPDPEVTAVRGQVVVVDNPGLSEFFIGLGDDHAELVYFFPHGDTAVLGGTEETGNWSTSPDPATAKRILRKCAAAEPRLAGARVTGHRVGLRPFRPEVRLETQNLDDGRLLVHNYGHGGAGVTLSWGCALEVAGIVARSSSGSRRSGDSRPAGPRSRRSLQNEALPALSRSDRV